MRSSQHQTRVDTALRSVASLGEPVRRTLYRYVVAQDEPVSREQAAAGVGVAHHVAKFHLDRLEADLLLEVEYRRPAGRTGPGAGRPTKYYRRAAGDIDVSLPERHYDLAGRIMAEAITTAAQSGTPLPEALHRAAVTNGTKLGKDAAKTAGPRPSRATVKDAICEVLDNNGYQPNASPTCITLANCPFHSLAQDYAELVCGINLDLVGGLLNALDETVWRANLDPAPGRCCVTITRASRQRANLS
jgi:predicted ArsR family transcriptional regulator